MSWTTIWSWTYLRKMRRRMRIEPIASRCWTMTKNKRNKIVKDKVMYRRSKTMVPGRKIQIGKWDTRKEKSTTWSALSLRTNSLWSTLWLTRFTMLSRQQMSSWLLAHRTNTIDATCPGTSEKLIFISKFYLKDKFFTIIMAEIQIYEIYVFNQFRS